MLSRSKGHNAAAIIMFGDNRPRSVGSDAKLSQRHMEAHSFLAGSDADTSHTVINRDFRNFCDIGCNDHACSPAGRITPASNRDASPSRLGCIGRLNAAHRNKLNEASVSATSAQQGAAA